MDSTSRDRSVLQQSLPVAHRLLLFAGSLALVLSLTLALAPNWSRSTYYDYGWLVPCLVLFFLFRRSKEHLGPVPETSNRGQAILTSIVLVISLLLWFPLRYIQTFDPLWRFPLWIHAFCFLVALHSLVALHIGWKKSLQFLPASGLILTAVPLPSLVETPLISLLTRFVVNSAENILLLSGFAIERIANIFVANGCVLDVAEGCSGVRSFQSSVMAAMMLGEFVYLRLSRRVLLVAVSIALAVFANTGRIIVLSVSAYRGGQDQLNSLHDPVGASVLFIVFFGLSIAAYLLMPSSNQRPKSTHSPSVL